MGSVAAAAFAAEFALEAVEVIGTEARRVEPLARIRELERRGMRLAGRLARAKARGQAVRSEWLRGRLQRVDEALRWWRLKTKT